MAKLDKRLSLLLSEPVEDAYLDCIDDLVINICKHLKTGKAFRTARWETEKLAELGQLTAENAKIINRVTKNVPSLIREALEESQKIALSDVEKMIQNAIKTGAIEAAPTDSTQKVLEDLMERAISEANLTNTTMLQSGQAAYIQAVENTVSWQNKAITDKIGILQDINTAAVSTQIHTETFNQALKRSISQLSEKGIYGFVDKAGRHWSPEAYMSMCIRTASHNASIDSIRAKQQDYNSDIFQISSHAGARPLCYPYQGKFYCWGREGGTFTDGRGVRHSYKPISSTSYGEPAGIFGINCGHYPLPQIPRVSIPSDGVEQNKEENDREYALTQQQRALERRIRDAKRKESAFRAAGLTEEADAQKAVIRSRQADMRAFIKNTGFKRQYDREQIK